MYKVAAAIRRTTGVIYIYFTVDKTLKASNWQIEYI